MGRENWKPGNLLNPVPAVMVSCQRPGEKPNIITIAWAGTICSEPPMVSISVRPSRHSYGIIHDTGEFAINLVTKDLTAVTDYCGVRSGKDVDKFRETGLTPVKLEGISAPGIDQSPLILACRVKEEKALGSHVLFIAEVVSVSVDESRMDENRKLRLNDTGLVAYSHGEYFLLGKKLGKFGFSVRKGEGGRGIDLRTVKEKRAAGKTTDKPRRIRRA